MELDLIAIQQLIISELPDHTRWLIKKTPLDFDFSIARKDLHAPTMELIGTE